MTCKKVSKKGKRKKKNVKKKDRHNIKRKEGNKETVTKLKEKELSTGRKLE